MEGNFEFKWLVMAVLHRPIAHVDAAEEGDHAQDLDVDHVQEVARDPAPADVHTNHTRGLAAVPDLTAKAHMENLKVALVRSLQNAVGHAPGLNKKVGSKFPAMFYFIFPIEIFLILS